MGFFIYDISFLILFSIFVAVFLYLKRKNLEREGILFLYRTKIGIKAINYIGDRYAKVLHFFKYVIVAVGYVLMVGVIYLFGQAVWIYLRYAKEITTIVKAPPIAPLIPYFPKIFGMESFFPPFYFTYFILAILIVAIVHEFSHGIFMRLFKIKIKSTGFAFLGPLLGAFVEQDDKQMKKKKNFEQRAVLAAGTFANVAVALIFFGLFIGFFYLSFTPSGYVFNTYSYSTIPVTMISNIVTEENLTEVYADGNVYFLDDKLKGQLEKNLTQIIAYDDAPAFRVGMEGAIYEIDGVKIFNQKSLQKFLENKEPGDTVLIKTILDDKIRSYELILGKHPLINGKSYIGVASIPQQNNGIVGKFLGFFMSFKNPSTYYATKWDGDFVFFIYNFLWWVMVINLLVAFFNMLPLGILDGGRFFYLTILSITKSESFAKKSFKFITYLILFLFLLIMFLWLFAII